MTRIVSALVVCCLLSVGCASAGVVRPAPARRVVPDQAVCHELAEGLEADLLVTAPDGTTTVQRYYLPAGWAVCGPGAG